MLFLCFIKCWSKLKTETVQKLFLINAGLSTVAQYRIIISTNGSWYCSWRGFLILQTKGDHLFTAVFIETGGAPIYRHRLW